MTGVSTDAPASELDVLSLVRATILVTDRNGTILRAHGGGGRPLGYAPKQLEGHNGMEFIAPQDHQVMADMYLGVARLPIVANPEPFPLHIVGPDGITRVWDCVPGGFAADDVDGWIVTLTCRKDQNPSIAAMDCFVAGGSPVEIANAVAHRYHENSHDGWRKTALVLYRSIRPDGSVAPWRAVQRPATTDQNLSEALEACIDDPDAVWNHLGPGSAVSGCALPELLETAAANAGVPYCTVLAAGIGTVARIAFVRLSNFEYELQGNNKLADQAINTVLQQAFEAERARVLLDQAMRTDPLTGIANRLHFEEVVAGTKDAVQHAALFVDIDRFKTVNDTFGHGVGDEALREVARRLVESCRPHDMVARIGGDEFGIVLRNVTDNEAHEIAERIRKSMQAPFALDQGPGSITVTVGVAPPTQHASLEDLVRQADHAMLADKAISRASF